MNHSESMAVMLKQKRETPLSRALKRFAANRGALVGLSIFAVILFCIVCYPLFVPHKPNAINLVSLNRPPGGAHFMGTDGVGRDVLARTLEGGRISLMVGLGAAAISLAIGFLLGSVAAMGAGGKKGRWLDGFIMRFVDLTMTLPPIVLLLVLSSMAGQGILPTILVIGGLAWPVLARMVRARLLELRERDFVLAARGLGAGNWYILLRHGLPGVMDILIVFSTMQVAAAILLEAGLSFIGLGIPPPAASWGNMLNAARSTAVLEQYPWQWLFPGLVLALTVLTLNFIGDGLRDAFDPRSELMAK